MIQYAYLVIEGPHDVEFIGRFLKLKGFSRVRMMSELDEFWHQLVPREFPFAGDLLGDIRNSDIATYSAF